MGQNYALLWLSKRCHRALSGTLRGYCPNGVDSIKWQIQQMPPGVAASSTA